jgi:adenine-specific DNA methylase
LSSQITDMNIISLRFSPSRRRISSLTTNRVFKLKTKKWQGSAAEKESTLHQLAPYIGKMKSSMAETLISAFAPESEIIYDPFCGSGSAALQAWFMGRNVIANDLSPYAVMLTRAKLFPLISFQDAHDEIEIVARRAQSHLPSVDLRKVPNWVRSFLKTRLPILPKQSYRALFA